MKKTIIMPVLTSLIIALALLGCRSKLPQGKYTDKEMKQIPFANKYELPDASGGMVLGIYSETISEEEIIAMLEPRLKTIAETSTFGSFQQQTAPYFREAIRGKVTDILLYQEARKTAPENIDDQLDKAVENEIVRFVASYNNNYALAQAAIENMGMTWTTFREYEKKLIMTQSHLSGQFKDDKRYSYQELLIHYNTVKAEQYCKAGILEFSLIVIKPDQLTAEQIQDGESSDAAAQRIAKDLLNQLKDGADFAELAKQHSHGPLATLGGKWLPVTIGEGSLAKPYDIIEEKALDMTAGQIKGPIVTDGQYLIVKLHVIEEGGCTPFQQVQDQIVQQLKFQERQQQYQDVVKSLMLKADIVQIERFNDFCVKQAYQRWNP